MTTVNTHRIALNRNERGIALVLSLFLMAAMSVLAVSLMFMSQTETYSSMNYRLMSQARYGAESGIQIAVNYLLNSYTPPTTGGVDPLASYDMTKSPVTYNGQPVVLSGSTAKASNYPIASIQTGFSTAVKGTVSSGSTTVAYAPYATLLSMQQVKVYGGGMQTIQSWQITSDGTITAGKTATVEVTAVLEAQRLSAQTYAAFAANGGCGALSFSGGATTDSYDSTSPLVNGLPVLANNTGNVGTNGNLTESQNATINGSLSTPRVGVGGCSAGNVDAWTSSGGATVTGGIVQLPQAIVLGPPDLPNPLPPTTTNAVKTNTDCASAGISSNCSGDDGVITLDPNGHTMTLGNIQLSGQGELHLKKGTYNANSLNLAGGNTKLIVDSGPAILNIVGSGETVPIDTTGGTTANPSFDAGNLQFQYAGTSNIKFAGNSQFAGVIYAPKALVTLTGTSDFYGAVIGDRVVDTGGAHLHYDKHLSEVFFIAGNAMLSSFSWKKY